MSKESFIGGDYIETTGGSTRNFAGENIENSSTVQFVQNGNETGVSYNVNTAPPSLGNLDLIKIKINTNFDICHDEVSSYSEFKNFWILEDKGKYYHWLSLRSNSDDKNKPDPLPITLASTDNFVLTATFKTKAPIACKIRLQDSDKKYIFKEQQHPKKKQDEEHELTFVCDTKPYKDTVQYFENLTLNFEYSEDGTNWAPMKSVKFCLYLTWKKPLYSTFDTTSAESMQIKCNANNNKENICESLLWLGCKDYGKNIVTSEEILLDKIFEQFKTLKIIRRRETKWNSDGLGYWRNASSAKGTFVRGLRSLLKDGEARCGEWTTFLQHILLSQGLSVGNDTIGICTQIATQYGFPINPTIPGSYSQVTSVFKPIPTSYQFAVKNAIHSDLMDPNITSGDSPGQGNPKSQPVFIDHFWFYYTKAKRFYDASYGKAYNATDSNLKKYCADNLSSIFLIDSTGTIGSIETSNLHNYIRATKKLF